MNGVNNKTGKLLKGHAHVRQSITDILTTPIGSRVMRRDYGSRLFELVDAPTNEETIAELYAAAAEALDRWEPRLHLFVCSFVRFQGIANCSLRDVQLTDHVTVQAAEIVEYNITANLVFYNGPGKAVVAEEARKKVAEYAEQQHKLGFDFHFVWVVCSLAPTRCSECHHH